MKHVITYLFLIVLIISCQENRNVTFEALSLQNSKCEECPEVSIDVPKASGNNKLSKSINLALKEEVISKLTFDDELNAETIQQAIESFTNKLSTLKQISIRLNYSIEDRFEENIEVR